MSLIVTGASGHLGRRVAELLLDRVDAADLVLVTRSPERLADLAASGVDVRHGDFDDPTSLTRAFAGGERLLLISTDIPGVRIPQHAAAIDAARDAGVSFVAYTSAPNPAAENPALVVPDHAATEELLRESGLAWCFLRNALYSEYQLPAAQAAAAAGELRTNERDGLHAYVSREDCAAIAAAVVAGPGHEGAIYDVTGPEALGAADRARIFGQLAGREVRVVPRSDNELTSDLVAAAVPEPVAATLVSFGRAIREGFLAGRSDHVERLTGRAPTALRDVLAA